MLLALRYIKSLIIWNEVLKIMEFESELPNSILNSKTLLEKIKLLSQICPRSIEGYKISPNESRKDDEDHLFILEFGLWDIYEYIDVWISFIIFSLKRSKYTVHASKSLLNAINEFSLKTNTEITKIIESLWNEMWILGMNEYADIKKNLVWNNLSDEDKDVFNLYINVSEIVEKAKQSSSNLDEWIHNLYIIKPEVWYSAIVSIQTGSEDAMNYYRYFDEVSADIGTIYDSLAYSTIMCKKSDIVSDYVDKLNASSKNETDFFNQMRYDSNSRIEFPYYWYDNVRLILSHPDDYFENISLFKSLNNYDDVILIGYICQLDSLTDKGQWFDFIVNRDEIVSQINDKQINVKDIWDLFNKRLESKN